ncbi:uncharacterized protein BP01DRAFT_422385 [Aspergillus saccharolyticus JOP 1030-1]|uniref:Uncharacterized protein n=1 Tax=Aspergillus saccharolyticus JOP 1030-1 TaxID=1450539 RepID=A0A318ZPM3_9EURO|nr:hypothetical protein BP01DRAFT_422385 [Aspergillus saccharolyticus JOP 1030-1]PYH46383.1 hypothetical protein BP01DRAFT_422385 [Aspergillus saccharolyticus JOP 1030-1]
METIVEVSRGISALQSLLEENPATFLTHGKEIKRLYKSFKALIRSSDELARVQEEAQHKEAAQKQRDEKAAHNLLNSLLRNRENIEKFSKKDVATIIDNDNKEDFRVRDGKQVGAKKTMEMRFRAGLAVSSLAEDYLQFSHEGGYHSKLDAMLLDTKKGATYQAYANECAEFVDKKEAALLIGIGVKFKFLEKVIRDKLRETSVDGEVPSSLPCAYVWITFFAWSWFIRCSSRALQLVAQSLISTECWKNLAVSTKAWRDKCYESYTKQTCELIASEASTSNERVTSFSESTTPNEEATSPPELSVLDEDATTSHSSPASPQVLNADEAATTDYSLSMSSESLSTKDMVEEPVVIPSSVRPLAPSLEEISEITGNHSIPAQPTPTKRPLSDDLHTDSRKSRKITNADSDNVENSNAMTPPVNPAPNVDPFDSNMEYNVLASIAQGVSVPTVDLSPHNQELCIDIWNHPTLFGVPPSHVEGAFSSAQIQLTSADVLINIWDDEPISESLRDSDDTAPCRFPTHPIDSTSQSISTWDNSTARTSSQGFNHEVSDLSIYPAASSRLNIDTWDHTIISGLSGGQHDTYRPPVPQARPSSTEIDNLNCPSFFTRTRDDCNDESRVFLLNSSTGIDL